jgi:hypothetical protein
MNSKKAKKLRALVRHLQNTGAIESKEWIQYGHRDRTITKISTDEDGKQVEKRVPDTTLWLMPGCGRAVYQQMKDRTKVRYNATKA